MRFYTVLASRPQYYDRNPVDKPFSYISFGVGPHAGTTRWSYTVPAAKKAFIEFFQLGVTRSTASTSTSITDTNFQLTPSGGASTTIALAEIRSMAVGAADDVYASALGLLQAGDVVTGSTEDLAADGANDWRVTMKATQFDA